jgi:hypothetical protein
MKPRVLFIVTSDPRVSPRPAEAVRIAAGVGVWQKAEVALYLRSAAVLALGETAEGLVDEDILAQSWPVLMNAQRPVYAAKGTAGLPDPASAHAKFTEISDDELARLAAEQNCVLHF